MLKETSFPVVEESSQSLKGSLKKTLPKLLNMETIVVLPALSGVTWKASRWMVAEDKVSKRCSLLALKGP